MSSRDGNTNNNSSGSGDDDAVFYPVGDDGNNQYNNYNLDHHHLPLHHLQRVIYKAPPSQQPKTRFDARPYLSHKR